MRKLTLLPIFSSALLCLGVTSCQTRKKTEVTPKPSAPHRQATVSFTDDIRPILADSCVNCHNRDTLPGRPSFESGELVASSGVILPGDPERSRMIHAISLDDMADTAMPPVGHRVSPEDAEVLKRWIAEGAYWPSGKAGRIRPTSIPRE